jgi:hypothetical protein
MMAGKPSDHRAEGYSLGRPPVEKCCLSGFDQGKLVAADKEIDRRCIGSPQRRQDFRFVRRIGQRARTWAISPT